MVKINRIYTKTGDRGETGLVGGARVRKDSLRVTAYGEVDELNSFLGLARTLVLHAKTNGKRKIIAEILCQLQNELFNLGSELATPPGAQWEGVITIVPGQISQLERWIDDLTKNLPELRSFVLPGGTELNAILHVARAVCRRAERHAFALSRQEEVSTNVLVYLNRISDLLFAMARYESWVAKRPEYLWAPGQQQPTSGQQKAKRRVTKPARKRSNHRTGHS